MLKDIRNGHISHQLLVKIL